MGDFQKTIKTSELAPGALKLLKIDDANIVLVNVGGQFYAFDDACPHFKARLSLGMLFGNTIMCLAHGNKYDVTTGKKIDGMGDDVGLTTHEVKVDGDDVLVNI